MTIPRWIKSTARALALVAVVLSALIVALQTGPARSLVASLIESAASSDGRIVKLEGLNGRLPHDIRIDTLALSDADGVWLDANDIHLAWSPLALLTGAIVVEDVEIRRLDWHRNPGRSPGTAAQADTGGTTPALAVRRIAIPALRIGRAVAGVPGTFAIEGNLDLLDPAARTTLALRLQERQGANAEVALDFSAEASRLAVAANLRDTAGGTLATMLGLPPDAPLAVDLKSTGPLDGWQAHLTATGGPALDVRGQATIKRNGSWRDLALTLDADIATIGPQALGPLLTGRTTVAIAAARNDDGALRLDRFDIAAPALSASAHGSADAARERASGTATIAIPDGRALAPLLGDAAAWRDLTVKASIEDKAAAPTLAIEANAADIAGAPATLKLRGKLVKLEALTDTVADIAAHGLALRFNGKASPRALDGTITLDAPNLANYGLKAGALTLQATVSADINAETFRAEGTGTARDLAVDDAIDGALQGTNTLAYALEGSGRELSISKLTLENKHLSLRAKGTAGTNVLDASGTVTLPDIAALAPEHAGRAEIEIHASGVPSSPRIAANARLRNGKLFGRNAGALAASLSEPDRSGRARLTVSGGYDGRPVQGKANVAWRPDGGVEIAGLQFKLASIGVQGNAVVDARTRVQGQLALDIGDAADIGPLIGENLSGPLRGDIRLQPDGGSQSAVVALNAPHLRIDTSTFFNVAANGSIADVFAEPRLNVRAKMTRFEDDGFALEAVDATGSGRLNALSIAAKAMRGQTALAAKGTLHVAGKPTRIEVDTFELARAGKTMRLTQAAQLTIGNHRVLLPEARLAAGRGSATVSGDAGRNTDLRVAAGALPLWVADFVSDEPLPVIGALSGTARIGKHGAATFDVKIADLAPASQPGILRNMTLSASGKSDKTGADVKLTVVDRGRTSFRADGRIPFGAEAPLALTAEGSADLALANAYLNVAGDRARGLLTMSAKITGTMNAPRIEGTARIANGLFRSAESGFELRNIEATLAGNERQIAIAALTAAAPNGGKFAGQGSIRLEPLNGYPLSLNVKASSAQLASTELMTVVADVEARMTGSLTRQAQISGTATLDRWDIRVPQKLARPLNPIRVTHRNAPPGFKAEDAEQPEGESGLAIGLDVTVRAPRRVFVRGQGIDAEFAGNVKITGTVADPVADGRFELRRGEVSILSQRIALTRGDIVFAGSIVPTLDIAGEVRKSDLTATVAVKGKATEPAIALSSTPALPQDEIMARLLFGKSVQQLSAFEAAQLAAAVARWSGLSTGPDIIERLRSALGIDALSAVTDSAGGTAVSAGTYVGKGVYVGLVQGADTTSGRATVEIDVSDNVKLRGEASPSGDTKVGVVAEWEY